MDRGVWWGYSPGGLKELDKTEHSHMAMTINTIAIVTQLRNIHFPTTKF